MDGAAGGGEHTAVAPARPRAAGRVAALFVLPYVVLALVWVFANPAGAAPDENDHLVKALGLARLDIGTQGPPAAADAPLGDVRNDSIARIVRIPARLDPSGLVCFQFRPDVSAACQADGIMTGDDEVAVRTTLGSYPPFLYPVLGAATWLGDSAADAIRWGRLAVLLLSAPLLWLACRHLARWLGPPALLGVALGVTPMAVFCMGVLGTSAFEILGALCWGAAVVVYRWRPESLEAPSTWWLLLVGGLALVLSRQLGVVTLAVLAVLLLALGAWRPVLDALRRGWWLAWATVGLLAAACVAIAVWEVGYDHPVLLGPWLSVGGAQAFLDLLPQLVQEGVGRFGWLDVRPPEAMNLVWFAGVVALVVAGFVCGQRRDRVVLGSLLGVGLVVCVATYTRVFWPIGAGLQGRHVLPLLLTVPVWAGAVVAGRVPRWLLGAGCVVLPAVVLGGLALNAQRYAVGLVPGLGLRWFLPEAAWTPPLGWWPWLLLALAGCVGLGLTWWRTLRPDDERENAEVR